MVSAGSNPRLSNVTFFSNTAHLAPLTVSNATVSLQRCVFARNNAPTGAIYIQSPTASVSLDLVTACENQGVDSGAISITASTADATLPALAISRSLFVRNSGQGILAAS